MLRLREFLRRRLNCGLFELRSCAGLLIDVSRGFPRANLRSDVGKVPLAPLDGDTETLLGYPTSVRAPNRMGDVRKELLLLDTAAPNAEAVERVRVEEAVGTGNVRLFGLGKLCHCLDEGHGHWTWGEKKCLSVSLGGWKELTKELAMGPSRMR